MRSPATVDQRPTAQQSSLPTMAGSLAMLGTIATVIVVQGWTRWLLSDEEATPTPTGPDDFGGLKLAWMRVLEFGGWR